MNKVQIKFGKIDRTTPLSLGGDGSMEILLKSPRGEWVTIGSVQVHYTLVDWQQPSRWTLDALKADLEMWIDPEETTLMVRSFDRGMTPVEARRELKAMIVARVAELQQAA